MTTNILIVDDSLVERLLVEGLLRTNPNYHVASASQGDEALERMASQPPDLLITGTWLPGFGAYGERIVFGDCQGQVSGSGF